MKNKQKTYPVIVTKTVEYRTPSGTITEIKQYTKRVKGEKR